MVMTLWFYFLAVAGGLTLCIWIVKVGTPKLSCSKAVFYVFFCVLVWCAASIIFMSIPQMILPLNSPWKDMVFILGMVLTYVSTALVMHRVDPNHDGNWSISLLLKKPTN